MVAPVVSGQWSVVSGQWSVVSGQWSVVSGQALSLLAPTQSAFQNRHSKRLRQMRAQPR
jgi:hypothetical protein